MAVDSNEQGINKGLSWIDGHVVQINPDQHLRVPHVGWNELIESRPSLMFQKIESGAHFYFDHSFHLECSEDLIAMRTNYGSRMVAAIEKENLFATQFHPEKSQRNGLKLIRNFLNYVEERR